MSLSEMSDEQLLELVSNWREGDNFTTGEAALAEAITRLLRRNSNLPNSIS